MMQLNNHYREVFGDLAILGMIHLAGRKPIKRALEEIKIYEEWGMDGAIVENYFGSIQDVSETLQEISRMKPRLKIGVNILPNNFKKAFQLAEKNEVKFIQLDHVAGIYTSGELDPESYGNYRALFPGVVVLGGVWPKYYHPVDGSNLENDLRDGMRRADAVVVTGEETGMETPLEKIKIFRRIIGNHPLIIGSGLNFDNAYEQLCLADGAIVGSYLKKGGYTISPVDTTRVRELMSVAKKVREHKESLVRK